MMLENELPNWLQYLLVALQLVGLGIFLYFIWPHFKAESWRKKFIDNKQAFSIIIVFIMIFAFIYGVSTFFELLFPIERLDTPIDNAP